MTKVDRPEPERDDGSPDARRGRVRRRMLLIAGAVVVAAVLATAISVAAVRGAQNAEAKATSTPAAFQLPTPDPNSPPPPSASPSPSASASKGGSSGAAPKTDPRYGAPVASVVSRDSTATLAGGLTAKVQVGTTKATAVRAGEVSGSAIKVELELTNPGGSDVSLSQLAVNSYYGSDSLPATELSDGAQPLLGTLKAGETRKGVYLFSVPSDQSGKAVITVTDAAGTPITVFQ